MLLPTWRSWLHATSVPATRTRPATRRPATCRHAVESLEDRTLLSFASAVLTPVGSRPQAVAVADFNADRIPDVAVADAGGGVTILPGKGDGTFGIPRQIDAGVSPIALAVGDFNKDGKPDLAVVDSGDIVNQQPGGLRILLGQGDGTFARALAYDDGSLPFALALGDFNGDRQLDVAVADLAEGVVRIYAGGSDGTFARANVLATPGGNPQGLAAGDVNGDGKSDLLIASGGTGGTLAVFLGNGDGSFRLPTSVDNVQSPVALALADYNGDARPDVAVSEGGDVSDVKVLLGAGDGTFQLAGTYQAGTSAASLIARDFDFDRRADLAVVSADDNAVYVFTGTGDGTLQPAEIDAVDQAPAFVTAADLNGDGAPDLLVSNAGADDLAMLRNLATPPAATVRVDVPTEAFTGQPSQFIVSIFDAAGHVIPTYRGTVHFSSSDPDATLPPDYTFTSADQGHHVLPVTYATPGNQSVSAADVKNTKLTGKAFLTVKDSTPTVSISGPAQVLANTPYVLGITLGGLIQEVDVNWGDGTAEQFTRPQSLVHVYTDAPLATAIVVSAVGRDGTVVTAAPLAVTVLLPQINNANMVTVPPGGSGAASAGDANSGVDATLFHAASAPGPAVLIVATYGSNPVAIALNQGAGGTITPEEGDEINVDLSVVALADVRVEGAVGGDVLVAHFHYPAGLTETPTLLYYDPVRNLWRPVHGSTRVADSYHVDRAAHTITVVFDNTSTPAVTALTGTVFAVAIPVLQNNTAVVSNTQVALAATATGTASAAAADASALAELSRTATFVTSRPVTFTLRASTDAPAAADAGPGQHSGTSETRGGTDEDFFTLWDRILGDEDFLWLIIRSETGAAGRPAKGPAAAPSGLEEQDGTPPREEPKGVDGPQAAPEASAPTAPAANAEAELEVLAGDVHGRHTDLVWGLTAALVGLGSGFRPAAVRSPRRRPLGQTT